MVNIVGLTPPLLAVRKNVPHRQPKYLALPLLGVGTVPMLDGERIQTPDDYDTESDN